MLFNSLTFIVFFVVVVALYFAVPHRFRWLLLLIASCYFYMAFIPWYIFILFFLIVIDYFLGKKIERTEDPKQRLHWLWISILSNVGTLFVFKYFNFFNDNFAQLFGALGLHYSIGYLSLLLPLGLSFHTFQSLSYVIEVYRGKVPAEKHFGIYALYVMFFPQLVAGPIERPAHMIPQFRVEHKFSFARLVSGGQRMIWGFFKKIVVADHLALFVNAVYGDMHSFTGPSFVLATVFFAFQIYLDFSGYCDIALGAAEVLGFSLTENFDAPYFSTSIAEFWRRWHISLSSWLRDYLYYPMVRASKNLTKAKMNMCLIATFAIIGLWHGANWTFVVFGTLHGIYIVVGSLKKKPFSHSSVIRIISTFGLGCLAWIFFRAKSLADAWYVLAHLASGWTNISIAHALYIDRVDTDFFLVVSGIILVLLVEKFQRRIGALKDAFVSSPLVRTAAYAFLILLIAALWDGRGTEFIYFQF